MLLVEGRRVFSGELLPSDLRLPTPSYLTIPHSPHVPTACPWATIARLTGALPGWEREERKVLTTSCYPQKEGGGERGGGGGREVKRRRRGVAVARLMLAPPRLATGGSPAGVACGRCWPRTVLAVCVRVLCVPPCCRNGAGGWTSVCCARRVSLTRPPLPLTSKPYVYTHSLSPRSIHTPRTEQHRPNN